MYEGSWRLPHGRTLTRYDYIDLVPSRTYSHHWPPENRAVFCKTSKAKGNCRICCRNITHMRTLAFSRLPGRALWNFCAVRRLPLNHRWLRRKGTCYWSLRTASTGHGGRGAEERRATGLKYAARSMMAIATWADPTHDLGDKASVRHQPTLKSIKI